MAIGGGGGGTTTTHSTTYTTSTATTTILSCGFGGLQVNAWKVGTTSVVKAMCGSVQVWP